MIILSSIMLINKLSWFVWLIIIGDSEAFIVWLMIVLWQELNVGKFIVI